jgi:pantetheine-phosphate adenylyltransferase
VATTLRRCIYAGSFDPVTKGHMYMIREGAKLFDRFIIAVGDNPQKTSTFTLDQRLAMLNKVTKRIPNTEVGHFSYQYLVHYAKKKGAKYVLRGIRNEDDYRYERTMRNINGDIAPAITTIFLMPPREISEISSNFVKGLVGPDNWETIVKPYLPEPVYKAFLRRFQQ